MTTSSKLKVYTYYEKINIAFENSWLSLWQRSWEDKGFEAIVLTKEDVEHHPYYSEFVSSLQILHMQITGKPLAAYGLACWLRWLAYSGEAHEKFYVCDYDVINHRFETLEPSEELRLLDDDCPCIVSGTPSQFYELCKNFVSLTTKHLEDFKKLYKELQFVHFHDQEFFTINEHLKILDIKMSRERLDFLSTPTAPNFWVRSLVHYNHNCTSAFCQKINIENTETNRYNVAKDYLELSKIDKERSQVSEAIKLFVPCSGDMKDTPYPDYPLSPLGVSTTLQCVKTLLPGIANFAHALDLNLPTYKEFESLEVSEDAARLKTLFDYYGSDNSTNHSYHLVYAEVFKKFDRLANLNILEIGLGTHRADIPSRIDYKFTPRASIKAFKEYFPNAQIYGADIDEDILFEEDRIKTSHLDQLEADSFERLQESFGYPWYDIIIDDGLHALSSNLNTLNFALKNVKKGGLLVIEDLINPAQFWNFITFMLQTKGYKAQLYSADGGVLVVNF
jgi:hypothetical protein